MRTFMPLLLAIFLGVGTVGVANTAQASAPAETTPTNAAPAARRHAQAQPSAASTDAARYAAREQQAGERQDFRGGGASLYIGGSALTVALIIILAIIIL